MPRLEVTLEVVLRGRDGALPPQREPRVPSRLQDEGLVQRHPHVVRAVVGARVARLAAVDQEGDGLRGEHVGPLAGVRRVGGVLGQVDPGDPGRRQGAEERADAVAAGQVPEAVAQHRRVVGRAGQRPGVAVDKADARPQGGLGDVPVGLADRERGAVVRGRVVEARDVPRGPHGHGEHQGRFTLAAAYV